MNHHPIMITGYRADWLDGMFYEKLMSAPIRQGNRLYLTAVSEKDMQDLAALAARNAEFHAPWVFHDIDVYREKVASGRTIGLLLRDREKQAPVAVVNLNEPVRGGFQNAYLGYYIDKDYAGQGLMSEALTLSMSHAFADLGFHRLEANIQPGNTRSINLVKQLGFTLEGFSPKYLRIGGQWRDHERWTMLFETWHELSSAAAKSRLSVILAAVLTAMLGWLQPSWAETVYGPENLLRTMSTPFGTVREQSSQAEEAPTFTPMRLNSAINRLGRKLSSPRMYLPSRMILGQPSEFIIKGPPGAWVAIAMADKDSGAKPIYDKELHLGSDRKLVTLGKIPDGGVLPLTVETPIQGDLIGQCLYFEAAIWSKPDFSDLEIAEPVPSESQPSTTASYRNGVLVAAESEKKRGIKIVPEAAIPMQQTRKTGLDSGLP